MVYSVAEAERKVVKTLTNMDRFDDFVNRYGTVETDVGQKKTLPTLADEAKVNTDAAVASASAAQIAAATAMGFVGGVLYPSTAAGLAAVAADAYFTVAGDGANTYAILYRKTNGAAVEQARYASKAAYEGLGGAALIGYNTGSYRLDVQTKLKEQVRTVLDVVAPNERASFLLGGISLDILLPRMLTAGGTWRLPYYGFLYGMTQRITSGIPDAFKLIVDTRATIRYSGAIPPTTAGVFEPENVSGFTICSDEVERSANFECSTTGSGSLYLVFGRKCDSMAVKDIRCQDMHVLHTMPARGKEAYADIILDGANANVSTNAKAVRTESFFTKQSASGQGSVFFYYCDGGKAIGCSGTRCGSVVQSWGGDAAFGAQGTPSNDPAVEAKRLKCRNIEIVNPVGYATTNTWVFFCMTDGGRCTGGRGDKCGDVGFDVEGSRNIRVSGNTGKDATNGNFSIYFYADNVCFEGNDSILTTGAAGLHFHLSNESQIPTLCNGFKMSGGTWTTLGGPLGGCAVDACMSIEFSGITLRHSRVSLTRNNLFRVKVFGNQFELPRQVPAGSALSLIEIASVHSAIAMPPDIVVRENEFSTDVAQNQPIRLMTISNDDGNGSLRLDASRNRGNILLSGNGYAGLVYEQLSNLPGRVMIEENRMDGPIVVRRGGPSGSPYPGPTLTVGPAGINTNLDSNGTGVPVLQQVINP